MDQESDSIEISQESSLHHYRTELPNILVQMKLTPYELATYVIFKMTAGDSGACFKSNTTLCEEIGIGKMKLIEVKESLKSKGLIKITKRKHANGGTLPDLITVVDIWGINMKTMSEKHIEKGSGNLQIPGGSATRTRGVCNTDQGGPPRGHKEEPNEQERKQQQQRASPSGLSVPSPGTQPIRQSSMQHNVYYKDQDLPSSSAKSGYNASAAVSLKKEEEDFFECPKLYEKPVQLNDKIVQMKSLQRTEPLNPSPCPKIHECLNPIDIPHQDKIEISSRYPADIVKNAIEWATHPQTNIKKGLAPAIKWGCQNAPEVPKNPIHEIEENKAYAKKYDNLQNRMARVDVLSKEVEIVYLTGFVRPICISYSEKGFKDQFQNALRKAELTRIL